MRYRLLTDYSVVRERTGDMKMWAFPLLLYLLLHQFATFSEGGYNDDYNSIFGAGAMMPLDESNPVPDVKANDSDGPITLNQSGTLSVTVALDNSSMTSNADWWLVADTPFGLCFFTMEGWTTSLSPVYQGTLSYVDSCEVLNIATAGLSEGTYTFYFAVDTNMDGNITSDSFYYDSIVVNITQ